VHSNRGCWAKSRASYSGQLAASPRDRPRAASRDIGVRARWAASNVRLPLLRVSPSMRGKKKGKEKEDETGESVSTRDKRDHSLRLSGEMNFRALRGRETISRKRQGAKGDAIECNPR